MDYQSHLLQTTQKGKFMAERPVVFTPLRRTQDGDIWARGIEERGMQVYAKDAECGDLWIDDTDHVIGADGFVVPLSSNEFFVRYPDYVRSVVYQQVHRRLGWSRLSVDIYEDIISEIHVFLSTLSPKRAGYSSGKRDMVQLFDPLRSHGAEKGKFFAFMNQVIISRFGTLTFQGVFKDRLLFCDTLEDSSHDDQGTTHPAPINTVQVDPWDALNMELDTQELLKKILGEVAMDDREMTKKILMATMGSQSPGAIAQMFDIPRKEVKKTLNKLRKLQCVQEAKSLVGAL